MGPLTAFSSSRKAPPLSRRPGAGAGARAPRRPPFPFEAQDLGLRPVRPPPRPADLCPQIPEGAPGLLPRSVRFLRGQRSCTSLPRRPGAADVAPRAACVSGQRAQGWKNKQGPHEGLAWGLAGAGRKCAVRPERRTKPAREPDHPAVTPGPPR